MTRETTPLGSLTHALIDHALQAGAEAADAIAIENQSLSIEVLNGSLEHAERSEGTDIGLRVLLEGRQACVSASDLRDSTLQELAQRAVAMARLAPPDPYCGLAEPAQLADMATLPELDQFDPTEPPTPAEIEAASLQAEAAALGVDGVDMVQSTGGGYSYTRLHLSTSNGFSAGYSRSTHSLSSVAITGSGAEMERDYNGEARSHFADLPGPEEIGRIAGERAVARKGAARPPTGAFPVLFDERISASLIGHLVAAANGTSIARGASWLKDRLGAQILPAGLDLTENPHRPRIAGSRAFDAEGLPTQARKIVQDGRLMGWTLDLATARKLGLESTASASRGVSAPPSPSTGNLHMTPGTDSRENLIRDMGTGLIVTGLIGSTINPNTGDYSRGASGFWVENGEIIGPVNECTIAGNLLDFLPRIRPANDGRAHLSRVIPSLLVEGLTIAGA